LRRPPRVLQMQPPRFDIYVGDLAIRGNHAAGFKHIVRVFPCHGHEVHNSGSRRVKAGDCPRVRLDPSYLCGIDPAKTVYAVSSPPALELLQPGELVSAGGENDLATPRVRDAPLGAVVVEGVRTLYAEPCLQ